MNGNGRIDLTRPEEASPAADSVAQVARLSRREVERSSFNERAAHVITAFSGSATYVWLHVAWFVAWIALNVEWLGFSPFDPFPFGFLTMIVSLEAIFLSTFVLMAENRQEKEAERRAKVDLQVNMIAEKEITKAIKMLADLHEHLGVPGTEDAEVGEMQSSTRIEQLADATEAAEANT